MTQNSIMIDSTAPWPNVKVSEIDIIVIRVPTLFYEITSVIPF